MTIETSIYGYIKQNYKRYSERVALRFEDQVITYSSLFEKIDNVADHLYENGIRRGSVVAIHLPNCPLTVISVYAVAKLGGICNMIHSQMPKDALQDYLLLTGSRFLLTEETTSGLSIPAASLKQIEVWSNSPTNNSILPEMKGIAEDCAVYMASSGTSGLPRVVMLSHKAANALPKNIMPLFRQDWERLIGLSVAPYFHTLGFLGDMHRLLSYGAQMIILDHWDADKAIGLIKEYGVNVIAGVPYMFYNLLQNPNFNGAGISQLRYCYMGGDTIPPSLLCDLDERIGNGRVAFPVYGMTEAGAIACALSYQHDRADSCGYPILNSKLCVLTSSGDVAETGEGELLIHSENMMMGYLNNDISIRETFLSFNNESWIRTGDYGRIDNDGYVYFICRMKNLIIHNGYNIVPLNVEKVIRSIPDVLDACVFGKEKDSGTEDVFAAVVISSQSSAVDVEEAIRRACKLAIPKYSYPSKVVFVPSLPRKNMGKIDLPSLRELV